MGKQQEFTPPNGGVGNISEEDKRAAVTGNPVVISDEERRKYLDTYVPASQAIRDSTPELVAAINTGTAGVLEQYGQNAKPSIWFSIGKGIGYIGGTFLLHWMVSKVFVVKSTNSVHE